MPSGEHEDQGDLARAYLLKSLFSGYYTLGLQPLVKQYYSFGEQTGRITPDMRAHVSLGVISNEIRDAMDHIAWSMSSDPSPHIAMAAWHFSLARLYLLVEITQDVETLFTTALTYISLVRRITSPPGLIPNVEELKAQRLSLLERYDVLITELRDQLDRQKSERPHPSVEQMASTHALADEVQANYGAFVTGLRNFNRHHKVGTYEGMCTALTAFKRKTEQEEVERQAALAKAKRDELEAAQDKLRRKRRVLIGGVIAAVAAIGYGVISNGLWAWLAKVLGWP